MLMRNTNVDRNVDRNVDKSTNPNTHEKKKEITANSLLKNI